MIVNDLNFVSITILPNKADAILIVNPDAILSKSAPLQRFQPIAFAGSGKTAEAHHWRNLVRPRIK